MNQPRSGVYLSDFLAVTDVYLGNMQPSMRTSSSLHQTLAPPLPLCFLFLNRSKNLRLMVAHKDGGPVLERILAANTTLLLHATCDPKCHTGSVPHAPLEGPSHRPLDQASIPNDAQRYGYEGAVQGTETHEDEGASCESVIRE